MMKPLARCGGLRARIVEGGWIRVGDGIEEIAEDLRAESRSAVRAG
jgi:hypothetical protein